MATAGHDVTVLTHPVGRAENTAWLSSHPDVALKLEYIDGGSFSRRAHRLGQWSARVVAYVFWQRKALRRAQELHARTPFDVVHHVTLGTVMAGSTMWRLGIPFFFGPVASGQTAPSAAAPLFGERWRLERARTALVRLTRANPAARSAVRAASIVLTPNTESASLIQAMGASSVQLMCDTGVDPGVIRRTLHQHASEAETARPDRSRVVWIGGLIPRKGCLLAIDAFARAAERVDAELHILGAGPLEQSVRAEIAARGLDQRVVLHGHLPWDEAQLLIGSADVMLFTSLRETFGSQVIEGAAAGLPLVALDLHGVASLVPSTAAIKVPFTSPADAAAGLAAGLVTVMTNVERRSSMRRAALRFAAQESWPRRAARMTELYAQVVSGSQ